MTPRPFYRWKSFWLGLFVLVFMGWGWVQTMRTGGEFRISTGPGKNVIGLTLEPGVLRVWLGNDGIIRYQTFDYYISHWSGEDKWVSSALEFGEGKPGCATLSVPWCVLCSGALLGWICWLLWHWKREQRRRLMP